MFGFHIEIENPIENELKSRKVSLSFLIRFRNIQRVIWPNYIAMDHRKYENHAVAQFKFSIYIAALHFCQHSY